MFMITFVIMSVEQREISVQGPVSGGELIEVVGRQEPVFLNGDAGLASGNGFDPLSYVLATALLVGGIVVGTYLIVGDRGTTARKPKITSKNNPEKPE